jgi:hypothetical protein
MINNQEGLSQRLTSVHQGSKASTDVSTLKSDGFNLGEKSSGNIDIAELMMRV